jgi:hypothetical protein
MPEELDQVAARIFGTREELVALLDEARMARDARTEVVPGTDAASAGICAWNHFENIPTFFNWNNRPR